MSCRVNNGAPSRNEVTDAVQPAISVDKPSLMKVLTNRLEELGIDMETCLPGQHNHLVCPRVNATIYF